jgi:hypothetical protein
MPSSVIRSFTYDDTSKELSIVFRSGRHYIYQNVPKQTFDDMAAAFAKGEFFNAHIRDRFAFERRDSEP